MKKKLQKSSILLAFCLMASWF